jgi:hypothetical protein
MDEAARLLVLLALGGGAFALAGAVFAWFLDETRRIRRTLTQALGVEPQPLLVVRGRGAGIGFDLASGQVCVAWDKGGWRMSYRLDELRGVELIVDRRVAARAFRGEPRRPLDELADPQDLVRLRFVFDDPQHPDFTLDLWRPEDAGLRGRLEPDAALEEANRWLARMESVLRRAGPPRPATPYATMGAVAPVAAAQPRPRAGAVPPPWEDDDLVDDAENAIT